MRAGLLAALAVLLGLAAAPAEARPTSRPEIERMVVEEALAVGLDPDLALAVAHVESGFDANALSSAGARGVMQIMPATAWGEFGVHADELWDARLNVRLGTAFLAQLIERYGGRVDIALSHYNGGSAVRTKSGLRVIPATRRYVDAVLAWRQRFAGHPVIAQAPAPARIVPVAHVAPPRPKPVRPRQEWRRSAADSLPPLWQIRAWRERDGW